MNVKEMLMKLVEMDVLTVVNVDENKVYVEDSGSEHGWAYIYFNEKGEVEKVEKK